MRNALKHWLDSPRVTVLAPLTTLAIGLFFVFVWAPHPWGWRGIDQYDALARELARGEPFSTTDVPWGYTYYLAACLLLFGERTWVPVTIQVIINALTPLLVYKLARPASGQRIAALAAWITAVFSFNTVYASTQSSDSLCTVLFLLSALCFVYAHTRASIVVFAAAGALSGAVPQFRPNMILLPPLVAAGYLFFPRPRSARRIAHVVAFGAAMIAMLLPWMIRNYRYTGELLPTSTHGGIQLWYGSLQTGKYLESQAHNPRYIFASAPLPYTSVEQPIVVHASTCARGTTDLRLFYRTDRDRDFTAVSAQSVVADHYEFDLPAQQVPTRLYYYFDAGNMRTPAAGPDGPFVYFISSDHLGDLDERGDLVDIFDIVRLMRHIAWTEPLPANPSLDLNEDGAANQADLSIAVAALVPEKSAPFVSIASGDAKVTMRLADGSTVTAPKQFATFTDLDVEGDIAGTLISRWKTAASFRIPEPVCPAATEIKVNDVFYRREPHLMRRYTALAFDNIRRDPIAFALASAYRMVRLFIIRGTDDRLTTFQFRGSHLIFQAGLIASLTYLLIFLAGVVIAWRAKSPFRYALIPIVYVPLTICFVLTNMRYTITVQPLMFVFVAIAIATALKLDELGRDPSTREA